jgi:ABC-2 type transport system permease protein
MPGWFQPIAEYQPFTPAIETLRGLPLGTEIGNTGGSRSPGASH